jgi:hypothetical protein
MAGFFRFDPSQPEASLMALVRFCDEIQPTPEQIPADFRQSVGIEVLANSLNLKFPTLPSFDIADATVYMSGRALPSLNLLVEAIARRTSDIDKLLCLVGLSDIHHDRRRSRTGRMMMMRLAADSRVNMPGIIKGQIRSSRNSK